MPAAQLTAPSARPPPSVPGPAASCGACRSALPGGPAVLLEPCRQAETGFVGEPAPQAGLGRLEKWLCKWLHLPQHAQSLMLGSHCSMEAVQLGSAAQTGSQGVQTDRSKAMHACEGRPGLLWLGHLIAARTPSG